MNQDYVLKEPETSLQPYRYLSWTAIIVGTLVALGLSFLFNLLSVVIGLTAFTTSSEGVTTLAISGFIGMAIGVMIVMFIAGWVSGFLGRSYHTNGSLGVLYGFTTWSLTLVLGVVLASNMVQFMAIQDTLSNSNSIILKVPSNSTESESAPQNTTSEPAKVKEGGEKQATVNVEAVKTLDKSLLLAFLLFLIGAITCSYGGYVGMMSPPNNERTRTGFFR